MAIFDQPVPLNLLATIEAISKLLVYLNTELPCFDIAKTRWVRIAYPWYASGYYQVHKCPNSSPRMHVWRWESHVQVPGLA